jgi:hypothetical protein
VVTGAVGDISQYFKKFDLAVFASPDGSHLAEGLNRRQELLRVEIYDAVFRYSGGYL